MNHLFVPAPAGMCRGRRDYTLLECLITNNRITKAVGCIDLAGVIDIIILEDIENDSVTVNMRFDAVGTRRCGAGNKQISACGQD